MARTLKSTGVVPRLATLFGVDDDNTTVKCFKAYSNQNRSTEITSSVNSSITVDSGVSISTTSWNGHTSPYIGIRFVSSAFKTIHFNSLFWNSGTGDPVTVFAVLNNIQSLSSGNAMFGVASGTAPNIGYDGSAHMRAFQGGSTVLTSSRTFSSGDSGLVAFYVTKDTSTQNRFYWGAKGGSVASDSPSDAGLVNFGTAAMNQLGGDASNNGLVADYLLWGAYSDNFGSDSTGNTNRLAALQSILDDPYGYFFDAPAQFNAQMSFTAGSAVPALTGTFSTLQLKVAEVIPTLAGKTGVDIRVYPSPAVHGARGADLDHAYNQTIDGSGTISIAVPNCVSAGKQIGDVGWLECTNSDGTVSDVTGVIAAGPVTFKVGP